jgi:hypothetical protein
MRTKKAFMKHSFIIISLSYILLACNTDIPNASSSINKPHNEKIINDTLSIQAEQKDKPKVEVKISFIDTTLKFGDNISINITLTNAGSTNQRLLFDKPNTGTGGPWGTSASVINTKTNKTAIQTENKAILSSQIYSEDKLHENYYNLIPNQSISRKYELTDIVVINNNDNKLPKGDYIIQLNYYNNISNSLTLTIK